MRVATLELTNVRQFSHKRLEFGPGFNLLVGETAPARARCFARSLPSSAQQGISNRLIAWHELPLSLFRILEDIGRNELLLPRIQRPFVWEDEQMVRLFDSLMRGYPKSTLAT